jgi:hypothetical protein
MLSAFDARVVSPDVLRVLRACQERVSYTLGGGAALSGAHLGHRLSRDVDLARARPRSRFDLRTATVTARVSPRA